MKGSKQIMEKSKEDYFNNLDMSKVFRNRYEKVKCCFCGKEIIWKNGNNPEPVEEENKRCCNSCNNKIVIPAREKAAAIN